MAEAPFRLTAESPFMLTVKLADGPQMRVLILAVVQLATYAADALSELDGEQRVRLRSALANVAEALDALGPRYPEEHDATQVVV